MTKITENLDKAKFEMLKAHVVNVLSVPEKQVATKDRSRMVTHWGRKWEFECESDTECFTTESIFDAVDWLYAEQDPYKEESKPESEVKFSAEVNVQVTDEYIEKVKREAKREILEHLQAHLDVMAQQSWELYIDEGVEQGNDMHLGEQRAFAMTLAQVNTILKNLQERKLKP